MRTGWHRPLTQLWPYGEAPAYMRMVIQFVRMLGSNPVSNSPRLAWNDRTSCNLRWASRKRFRQVHFYSAQADAVGRSCFAWSPG